MSDPATGSQEKICSRDPICLAYTLHTLRQRTLVLAGDDDPLIPLINARLITARIPDEKLRIVDCGHLFLLTRASIPAPEIEQFLN